MNDMSMSKKRLSINLVANVTTHIVSMVVSFFITPYIVTKLGKEVYGFYGMANNVVNYITIISVALNSMAAKYITVELVRGNELKAQNYYSSIFYSNVIFSAILLPFLVLLVVNVNSIFVISSSYLRDVQILFCLVMSAMLLRFITCVYGCATYATNRIDIRAYTELGKTALRVLLFGILFTVLKPSIIFVGLIMLSTEIYNAIAHIIIANRLIPSLSIRRKFCDFKLVLQTLKVGIWNSLSQLGDLLLSSSDLIMGNIMLGEAASGNLSIVKTIPSMISGFITAINAVFMPRISVAYGKDDKQLLTKEVNMSQRIMGVFSTVIVMLFIIFGKEFFDLWVPGNDSILLMRLSAIDVSRMMIIGVSWPVVNLNVVMDKIRKPSLFVIGGGILNVISMFVLLKTTTFGIYIIPATTLVISLVYYGVFIPLYSAHISSVPWYTYMRPVFEMLICAVMIFWGVLPVKRLFTITSWLEFFVYGGICGIIALLIGIMVFVKPSNIKSTLKSVIRK